MPTEDYAIVLDYLPEGRADSSIPQYKREKRLAQILGEEFYSLLEVVIREGQTVAPAERVYIGKAVRDKIHHIVRRISYDDLTSTAKVELQYTLENLIKAQETKFVRFFNECSPLTTRLHRLELLPGIGKKHMWEIIKIRSEKKFESFKDISERVKLLPNPEKIIERRIIDELKGYEAENKNKPVKYRIFVGAPLANEEKPVSQEDAKAEA